jgi:iron complex outermembrane receptor protein
MLLFRAYIPFIAVFVYGIVTLIASATSADLHLTAPGGEPLLRNNHKATLLLAIIVLLVTDPGFAEAGQLEEIIVTARKREESLQELPMSVTAISAEQIERLGIRNLGDITRYTPGVNLDSGFGLNDQRLVIRGLSPSRGRSNSAILVDGIDLTSESVSTAGGSMLFNSRLLDIQQVEVVKGPQSALYGRAAFAGALQYVTRDPAETLETTAGIDIGEDGRQYYKGGISGPVTDELGLAVYALRWREDGHYDEGFTDADLGGGDGYGISLTGKWEPTDNFSARGRVAYSDDNYDQQATLYDAVNTELSLPDSSLVLGPFKATDRVTLFSGTPKDAGSRQPYLTPDPRSGSAYPGGEQDALNTSLTLNWDIGIGSITSYTGYVKANGTQIFDGDFDVRPNNSNTGDIALGGTEVNFDTDTRMLSQEIRFASNLDGPVQFTVGALYWDEDVDQDETGLSVIGRFPSTNPLTVPPDGFFNTAVRTSSRIDNNVSRDTNSQSVYGMIEWNLNATWKFSAEARYAKEKMDVSGTGCDNPNAGAFPPPDAESLYCQFSTPDLAAEFPLLSEDFQQLNRITTDDTKTSYYVAPRAILEWTPAEDLMTYFSVSQGVKPGGIATVASGTWMDSDADGNLDELKFDDETLTAYELGAKTTWFDRTLILNGAVFYQDYDDKQIPVQVLENGFPFTKIENAGEAEVKGLEIDATWLVTDYIRLNLGYAFLDAEYTDLSYETNSKNSVARAGNCIPNAANNLCSISLSHNTMEDVPKHSVVAMAGYYPPLGGTGLTGILETDVEWQDKRYIDEFNDREVDSYSIVNMRAGVETDKWDAVVYVNNVFDDDTIQSWSAGTGIVVTAERTDGDFVGFPSEGFGIAPPPRQWGVRANVRF